MHNHYPQLALVEPGKPQRIPAISKKGIEVAVYKHNRTAARKIFVSFRGLWAYLYMKKEEGVDGQDKEA